MVKNLIDTNLIIRFLINDNSEKVSKIEDLLKDKKNVNFILDTIIAEIIWVLASYYELKKGDIIEKISALIHVESVECNVLLISKALNIWKDNNISYIDSYLAAVSELGNLSLYTYDQKLKSLPNIKTRTLVFLIFFFITVYNK